MTELSLSTLADLWNPFYFLFPVLAYFLSRLCISALYPRLVAAKLVALPEARSNHKNPTVTGGGLGILLALLLTLTLMNFDPIIAALVAAICMVSFYDDLRPMRAIIRLVAQFAAVSIALWHMPNLPFSDLLGAGSYLLFALAWVWWINLSNFMDGIDEMGIQQTVTSMLGAAILLLILTPFSPMGSFTLIIALATLGFISWNRHPARMFMGDAGSIPLGFITGYFFIHMMEVGLVFEALILPAYYVSDATSTLIKRIAQGKNPTQAHSEHAYQHAVRAGYTHSAISRSLAVLNLALVMLAVLVLYHPQYGAVATLLAYALCGAACVKMRRLKKKGNA